MYQAGRGDTEPDIHDKNPAADAAVQKRKPTVSH